MKVLAWRTLPPFALSCVGERAVYVVRLVLTKWELAICELDTMNEIVTVPVASCNVAIEVARQIDGGDRGRRLRPGARTGIIARRLVAASQKRSADHG